MGKLVPLPTARYTPRVLLHKVLDDVDELEAVVVVRMYKDGEQAADWSNMKSGDLAVSALLLNDLATRAIAGEFGHHPSDEEEGA